MFNEITVYEILVYEILFDSVTVYWNNCSSK